MIKVMLDQGVVEKILAGGSQREVEVLRRQCAVFVTRAEGRLESVLGPLHLLGSSTDTEVGFEVARLSGGAVGEESIQIAETAVLNDLTFVSDKASLVSAVKQLGGRALNFEALAELEAFAEIAQ